MGGVHGKSLDGSSPITQVYDPKDPRSPSFKRTPLSTPVPNWRQRAELARAAAAAEDPRSPSNFMRTPLQEQQSNINEPVTPLTLSYEDCHKLNPEDPRSPMSFRTPLNYTQGLVQYDTNVIACPPFVDDTVIITPSKTSQEETQDGDVTVTASSIINNPLADLSIVSSTEIKPVEEEEKKPIEESLNDIEVPSSPLGASACKIEDEQEKPVEKISLTGSPLLAERKRKKAPSKQLQGVSPLKKSFSSPSVVENDENNSNAISPVVVPRKTTPNTPRRSINGSPTTTRKTTPNKTTPNTARRMSTNLKNSGPAQRAPLSPITLHSKRSSDSFANSGNFIL